MSDEKKHQAGSSVIVHPPREGFAKGQWQGLALFALFLAAILAVLIVGNASPGTASGRVMDVLLGGAAAIFCVWVVGGTFEFESKWLDGGVKASGGAAIMVFVFFWWQPVYSAGSDVKWPIAFELPSNATLGFLLDHIEAEHRGGQTEIVVDVQNQGTQIRAFRPRPEGQKLDYVGSTWVDVLATIGIQSPCLTALADGDTVTLSMDMEKAVESPENGTMKYLCS